MANVIGINRFTMPEKNPNNNNVLIDLVEIWVVLTQGKVNDYAAYIGIPNALDEDDEDNAHSQWIAAHGNKLTFEQAKSYFPASPMTKENYRK